VTPGVAFVFAGGGTGGHLFPGLAIAEEILKRKPGARCVFLCSDRAIDAQILGAARLEGRAVEFRALPAKPVSLRPKGLLAFARSWGPSVRATRALIRTAGGPVNIISMGGFVAAPAVQGARAEKAAVTLVNLDAVPGKANRWIARRAARIFTAVPPSRKWGAKPWVEVPPIVRQAALAGRPASDCRLGLGLDPAMRTLLVTGASQGAGSINQMMAAFVKADASRLAEWQVIHQTGREGVEEMRAAYAGAGIPARVEPFFETMGLAWGAADLAVSRAGAGSVAEAWANRIPTIFMPYPYHKDQHQRFNALPLERAGGALVVTDHIEPGANLSAAGAELAACLANADRRKAMRAALVGLGPADGAARVAAALTEA
jgi:UDP-N-acetylglucosamine--N-acetylmuramyl-(pentapeptide) pyrophosphoryl-undecaprenol N-acetylglucosamine transferase